LALFLRQGSSLVLTDAGRAYLPSVEQAFRQLSEATRDLQSWAKLKPLKVNVPPTFVVKWLIPRMHRFLRQHPHIDLKVSTLARFVDFSRDDCDVDIRYGRGVYPGMHSELCLPVEVFPVCSAALLQGEHPLRTPRDLKYHTLLHDSSTYDDGSNPDWATWLLRAGVRDVEAARGPSFWPSHIVIDAAMDGLGVALAKKSWVEADLAAGRLVRPFDLSLFVEFAYFLVYPEGRAGDPLIAAFADWVRREIRVTEALQSPDCGT
jgi:LysR family glycine cleavage system transcriptional activator